MVKTWANPWFAACIPQTVFTYVQNADHGSFSASAVSIASA
jgi:hypothetical protein